MVTVTVPANNTKALLAAARMFNDLAGESVEYAPVQGVAVEDTTIPASSAEAPAPDTVNEIDPPVECGGIELDADGLPWDERIHASTQTQTQDGRWKKKRGVSKEEYDAVLHELKVAELKVAELKVAELKVAELKGETPTAEDTPPVPTPPAAADETPPAPPATAGDGKAFIDLNETPPAPPATSKYNTYSDVYEALEPNGLTFDDLTVACQAAGLKFPAMLAARPDLAPQVAQSLGLE